mgnify:CR=1 FL=1
MFKKKKIVLTSVLVLAGVSLATVGFATWVVGLQKTDDTLTISAVVDDSENKSIYLEAVTQKDEKIIISESKAHTADPDNKEIMSAVVKEDKTVGVTYVNANALKFHFTTLQYSLGKAVTEKPTKLNIELLGKDVNHQNFVGSEGCLMDADAYRPKAEYSYLKLNKTIKLEPINYKIKTGGDSYDIYDLNVKEFQFEWGTFFGNSADTMEGEGNKSPVTFYNSKSSQRVDGESLTKNLFDDCENANKELKAMEAALKGNLKIKVSLGFGA